MKPNESLTSIGNGRYELVKKLGSGGMGVVYEAVDKKSKVKVALKTLKNIDPASIFRLKGEFRSLSQIYHRNLVQLYELFSEAEAWYFTMELIENGIDIVSHIRRTNAPKNAHKNAHKNSGFLETTKIASSNYQSNDDRNSEATQLLSNNSYLPNSNKSVSSKRISLFQPCAISNFEILNSTFKQLCEGLSVIHKNNRLHRDLKPSNTLVTPEGRLVILDFGLVAELDTITPKSNAIKKKSDQSTGDIMGTAAFMSPEQAGGLRLTTASDVYSIGVILFQTLTGRLPFAGDAALVIRDKQNFNSVSPSEIVSNIPISLNLLCIKMLSRDPKERPTIDKIIQTINPDPVILSDTSFEAPKNTSVFIGRSPEINKLSAALHEARDGKTVVVHIQGQSGSGKSTLVERFIKISIAEGSIVLSGRCYENESVPYKAIDSLIDSLTDYLLQLRNEDIATLLPDGLSSLAKIFPVLLRIPYISQLNDISLPVIDVIQGRHVAFSCLRELLRRLSRRETLTIAIDDLQWGDTESSALLTSLLHGSDPPSMLIIFSYRNEYLSRSPSLNIISKLPVITANEKVIRNDITINNFSESEVRTLAKALLPNVMEDINSHIDWIVSESQGSAFFIYEQVRFIKSNPSIRESFKYELENVIWDRVKNLPTDSLNILKIISVAGRPLTLRDLQYASGENTLPIQSLNLLRSERLIRVESFRWDQTTESSHDRIRETIVSRLSQDQLINIHFSLATSLESNSNSDPEITAEHYFNSGRLDKASRYYTLAADKSLKLMAFERSEILYLKAMNISQELFEKIKISEKLIHFYTDMARFSEAYKVAKQATILLGISLPEKFVPPLFLVDWLKLEFRLRNKKIESLLSLNTTQDVKIETAIRIINSVAKAAYQIKPELCVWLSVKLVNLCLKYGNTKDCAIGYMVFGAIFKGGVLGRYRVGYQFGNLALSLVDQFKNDKQRSEVNFVVGYFGTSWMRPSIKAEKLWSVSFDSGIVNGDLFHTGCAAAGISMSLFMRGERFDIINEKLYSLSNVINKLNLRESTGVINCILQAILNLRNQTDSSDSFSSKNFSEEEFSIGLSNYGSKHFAHFYFILKMQSLYLWGKFDRAISYASAASVYINDSVGMLHQSEHDFYHALISLEPLSKSYSEKNRHIPKKVLKKFIKWSKNCPENFLAKEKLLSAQVFRKKHSEVFAEQYFLESIDAAIKFNQVHIQGLSELLYSRFLSEKNDWNSSSIHFKKSIDLFKLWGASGLALMLEEQVGNRHSTLNKPNPEE